MSGSSFTASYGVSVTFTPALELADEVQLIMGAAGATGGGSSNGVTADFVASGTLPNGMPVILNADGTVSVIESQGFVEAIPSGIEVDFDNEGSIFAVTCAMVPDISGRFVVVYRGRINDINGDYVSYAATMVVGTVNNDQSITMGAPIRFYNDNTAQCEIAIDPANPNSFLLSYVEGTSVYIRAGTLSGTTATLGDSQLHASGNTQWSGITVDPHKSGKFIAVYAHGYSGNVGIITLSGNTITKTSNQITGIIGGWSNVMYPEIAWDLHDPTRFAITFRSGSNNYGTVLIGNIDGTSITFGTPVTFASWSVGFSAVAFDPNQTDKLVIGFQQSGNGHGMAVVGTLSGNSVSLGSTVTFDAANCQNIVIRPGPSYTGKLYFITKLGKLFGAVISGTSIAFDAPITIGSANSNGVMDFSKYGTGRMVFAYQTQADLGKLRLVQFGSVVTNLSETNFIGITEGIYADGSTATVMLPGGISTNQTGLAIGSTYYVQADGTISTTVDAPAVIAGRALSATSIFLKGI
jgi:hypothetical protein